MSFNTKLMSIRRFKQISFLFEAICVLKEIQDLLYKRKRSCCVRGINRDRKRNGFFKVTFLKVKELDSDQFFVYTRMSPAIYNDLLKLLSPLMIKTSIRESISPDCRLAVLLLYLSQGTSMQSLASSFKLGKETVRKIVLETSEVLWKALHPLYVSEPNYHDCNKISGDFWTLWNMPNCVGAIDGKQFALKCPPNGASTYSDYKQYSSIVLMAGCDARYCFRYIDIGAYVGQGDGGIFKESCLGRNLLEGNIPIPHPKNLPSSLVEVPHYFIGDAAFPLCHNLMRPYSGTPLSPKQDNFNKRLSRVLRTIENSFGILVARWRVLLTTFNMIPSNAEKIILACVALHNFNMLNKENYSYCPSNYIDWEDSDGRRHEGLWREEVNVKIPSIAPSPYIHQYGGKTSKSIRNQLCDF